MERISLYDPLAFSGLLVGDSMVYFIGRKFGLRAIKSYLRLVIRAKHVYRAYRFFKRKDLDFYCSFGLFQEREQQRS